LHLVAPPALAGAAWILVGRAGMWPFPVRQTNVQDLSNQSG
jgi:hypothetical protein